MAEGYPSITLPARRAAESFATSHPIATVREYALSGSPIENPPILPLFDLPPDVMLLTVLMGFGVVILRETISTTLSPCAPRAPNHPRMLRNSRGHSSSLGLVRPPGIEHRTPVSSLLSGRSWGVDGHPNN